MAELGNFVTLRPGETKTMRFDQAAWDRKQRKDPRTGITSSVNTLVLHVIELDGAKVDTVFSVISQQLQDALGADVDRGMIGRYRYTISRGTGAFEAPRIATRVPV